jgi:hypothetical protein
VVSRTPNGQPHTLTGSILKHPPKQGSGFQPTLMRTTQLVSEEPDHGGVPSSAAQRVILKLKGDLSRMARSW